MGLWGPKHPVMDLGFGLKGHFTREPRARDREIVRAQKKVSKGRPNTPPQACSVVTDPQV